MALGNKQHIKADHFRPIKENVFVTDLDSGPTVTAGGIIRTDDNMTERGVRPRWARIWAIGPDVKDIEIGEWVLIEHGRWSHAIDITLPNGKVRFWKIEYPKSVLVAVPDDPRERQLSDLPAVSHPQSSRNNVRSISPAIIRKREY